MGVVYRQKGRSTWMLKYYRDGKAIYESSGTDVKDDANRFMHSSISEERSEVRTKYTAPCPPSPNGRTTRNGPTVLSSLTL